MGRYISVKNLVIQMNRILLLIIPFLAFPLFAQENVKISDFHRLLIFNDKNQLMVAKIKDTDFWVTPGLYSQNKKLTNENLHKLASEYGLTITQPNLRGVFILKNKKTNIDSNRYFFNVKVNGGDIKTPDNIEEIKWLPVNEAMNVITFPHITMLIKQIMDYPDVEWGGTVLRYKEGTKLKSKMIKSFYSLNSDNK